MSVSVMVIQYEKSVDVEAGREKRSGGKSYMIIILIRTDSPPHVGDFAPPPAAPLLPPGPLTFLVLTAAADFLPLLGVAAPALRWSSGEEGSCLRKKSGRRSLPLSEAGRPSPPAPGLEGEESTGRPMRVAIGGQRIALEACLGERHDEGGGGEVVPPPTPPRGVGAGAGAGGALS